MEMRQTATILAVVALMVVASSSAALAAYKDSITGTEGEDIISGTGKSEHILGLGGDDRLNGGGGGAPVRARDAPAVKDTVECGPGTDTVYADKADVVGDDCERIEAR